MIRKLKDRIIIFLKKGLTPNEIAFGVALGNFVGILPFLGFHTVMALGLAYLMRLNMMVVFLGTQISNPFSFPFILFISAQLGSLAMYGSFLNLKFTGDVNILKGYIMPTIIGSIILGLGISIPSYFITLRFAKKYKT